VRSLHTWRQLVTADHCLSYAGEMTAQEDETLESVIETEAIARKLRRIPEGFHRLRVFTQSDHTAALKQTLNTGLAVTVLLETDYRPYDKTAQLPDGIAQQRMEGQ